MGAGGSITATNNQGFVPPTQVTYMHQQPVYQQQQPVVPQQNQEGLQGGLTVTRPEDQAALLTTDLQQPQQQLPQHQQGFNTQTSYQQLAQPVAQHNYMLPPGMSTTTTIPPPAMHGIAPHPPPLQPFQTVQQQQGVSAANGQFMQVPINAQQQQFQEGRGLQGNSRPSLALAQKRVRIPREGVTGDPMPL